MAAEMAAQGKSGSKMMRSRSSVRLSVDASRADTLETEEGGLGSTLKLIAESTTPSPSYARYHEAHLQRLLSRLGAYPPRCNLLIIVQAGLSATFLHQSGVSKSCVEQVNICA